MRDRSLLPLKTYAGRGQRVGQSLFRTGPPLREGDRHSEATLVLSSRIEADRPGELDLTLQARSPNGATQAAGRALEDPRPADNGIRQRSAARKAVAVLSAMAGLGLAARTQEVAERFLDQDRAAREVDRAQVTRSAAPGAEGD